MQTDDINPGRNAKPDREDRQRLNVGLIGLGNLGMQIAENLIVRGHRVTGYRRKSLDSFVALGGIPAAAIDDLVGKNEIILTCLLDGPSLEQVISGDGGIASAARQGQVVVDLSTISIKDKTAQKSALSAKGASLMDATVSGNPRMLKDRLATIFVSGEQVDYARSRPVLEAITDNVSFVGAFGGGCYMKAIAVLLVAVHTAAAAEAMELATLAGIPRHVVFDAIKGSNASSAMFEHRGRFMVDGSYPVATGVLRRYIPNLDFTEDALKHSGGRYSIFDAASAMYRAANETDCADLDISAVFRHLMGEDRKASGDE